MNLSKLYAGATWNPEQWAESEWDHDLERMREIGFNVLRFGDFCWARIEPRDGEFDLDWVDRVLDRVQKHGIEVVLCTPTAGPPTWMFQKHPDIGYMDPNGYVHRQGGRQAADYCHPAFREYSVRIARMLAERFGAHPTVIAWQIDNELRGHQKLSLSPSAMAGWHRWLEQRYGTIDALNEAWGTYVWSHRYASFEEVPGPWPLPTYCHNHSLLTQFRRYMNDSVLEFLQLQVEAIRAFSDRPITHNSDDSVDEQDLFNRLDFASHDCYTRHQEPLHFVYRNDCFRALKPGRRFWLMETDAEGHIGEEIFPSGWITNVAMASYYAGAEAVLYWPWRGVRTGMEMLGHAAPVAVTGAPGSAWPELQKMAKHREKLLPHFQRFRPAPAGVAFVRAERNGHYYYIDKVAGLEPNFDYRGKQHAHYESLLQCGVWRDVVYDHGNLDGYKLIVSPYLPYISPDFFERIRRHLANGGVWIVGPYSGYLTVDHANFTNALLGDLERFLGISTQHFISLRRMPVDLSFGMRSHALMHGHIFKVQSDEESLGTYRHERLAGLSWGIRKKMGNGVVYLLGSELEPEGRLALYEHILEREHIVKHAMPQGVLRFPQIDEGGRTAWALVNTNHESIKVTLPVSGVNLATGEPCGREITLPPHSNALVEFHSEVTG
jgi:beta-galactosidase